MENCNHANSACNRMLIALCSVMLLSMMESVLQNRSKFLVVCSPCGSDSTAMTESHIHRQLRKCSLYSLWGVVKLCSAISGCSAGFYCIFRVSVYTNISYGRLNTIIVKLSSSEIAFCDDRREFGP